MAGVFLILTLLGAGVWFFLARKSADGVTVRGIDGVQTQVKPDNAADFARRQGCIMNCQAEARFCRGNALEPEAAEDCAEKDADCQATCGGEAP